MTDIWRARKYEFSDGPSSSSVMSDLEIRPLARAARYKLCSTHEYAPWANTRGKEARLELNETRLQRWMCGVTRRDKIRNEHHTSGASVQENDRKIICISWQLFVILEK